MLDADARCRLDAGCWRLEGSRDSSENMAVLKLRLVSLYIACPFYSSCWNLVPCVSILRGGRIYVGDEVVGVCPCWDQCSFMRQEKLLQEL